MEKRKVSKQIARTIADYMVDEGLANTTEGNWRFDHEEIATYFNVVLDDEAVDKIHTAVMDREEVLDIWGKEETGEDVFDINFGTAYYESGDEDRSEDEDDDRDYQAVNLQVENAIRTGLYGLPPKDEDGRTLARFLGERLMKKH